MNGNTAFRSWVVFVLVAGCIASSRLREWIFIVVNHMADVVGGFTTFLTPDTSSLIPFLISGGLIGVVGVTYKMIAEGRAERRRMTRDLRRESLGIIDVKHAGFDTNRLLTDDELTKVVIRLSTPAEEAPEHCPPPVSRPLTDGAWDAWTAGVDSIGIRRWSNGSPALDRPFTLMTDCQPGHMGEHHVGEHWTTPEGVTRVQRTCRYLCHSTWSEIV